MILLPFFLVRSRREREREKDAKHNDVPSSRLSSPPGREREEREREGSAPLFFLVSLSLSLSLLSSPPSHYYYDAFSAIRAPLISPVVDVLFSRKIFFALM